MELEKYNLKGTALKGSDITEKKVLSLQWQPNLKYSWDDGVAIGRYLKGFKEGKIYATKCNTCGKTAIPPRAFCETCFKSTDEWVECQQTGKINTFSICYVNWDASRRGKDEPPHLPAVIEVDGASEGQGMLHLLGGVDPKELKMGMKVKAVWKPENERKGCVTDIKYWQPY